MRLLVLPPVLAILTFASSVSAQGDGCRGALSALNRVKEEISPQLSTSSEDGRQKLQVMESTLERGTNLCKDFPELWFYRMAVSQRLGLEKEASYAKHKLDEFQYHNGFDPFSLPPAATPPAQQAGPMRVRQKWALVVGIDSFQDKRIPGLNYSVKDSRDFVNFLEDPAGGRFQPSHIVHLENEQATIEGIDEGIGRLRADAKPDDLVVIYLSSHGSPRDIDPNGVSYIVTHNTNLENAATLYATSLQMIDLVQHLNRDIKAQQVVLILDTCFSGDALSGLGADEAATGSRGFEAIFPSDPPPDSPASVSFSAALRTLKMGYGRAVITASRANEASWESSELKNGYFTHFLLDSLRGARGNEGLEQLFMEVRSAVSTRVRADHRVGQNPSMEFSEGADSIVIGVPETISPPPSNQVVPST
jgi:uncharacterized caspase-like protein